jgi:dolichol-phosphate mannosyltransferase
MISVIVPVYNERDNIKPLITELVEASRTSGISEIVYVDDGSSDGSLDILAGLRGECPMLRVIKHTQRSGQSAAFLTGVRAAKNALVVLIDGDGQNNPADIALLYQKFRAGEAVGAKRMVAGQRAKRQDNAIRKLSSRIANKIRSSILNDNIRDTGCSLKLIRREDYLNLPYFDHMHRFLPALLIRDGVNILTEDVSHRPRLKGTSKYGFWNRLWVGIVDLAGVRWLLIRGLPKNYDTTEIV